MTETQGAHPNSLYILPSDQAERARLQLQHTIFLRAFDNRLLPPGMTLQAGDRVLEAGAGSGDWAVDVATNSSPGVSISATDIDPRLFPVGTTENVSFSVESSLNLPLEWTSTYALCHQRLLVFALNLGDWRQVLSEFRRVLKPGGWIRLEETGPGHVGLVSPTADVEKLLPATRRHLRVVQRLCEAVGLVLECTVRLPEWLREAGFEDVQVERRAVRLGPGDEFQDAYDNFIGAARAVKPLVLRAGGFGIVRSEEDWDQMITDVGQEWKSHDVAVELFGYTARKASQAK